MAAALAVCAAPAAFAECRLGRVADMPMRVQGGKLLVDGMVNGNKATMVFDTGTAQSFFAEASVQRLNIRAMQREDHNLNTLGRAYGFGGSASARPVVVKHLDFGGLRARDFAIWAEDTKAPGRMGADGMLSLDILAKYDIDLDLTSQRIRLFYPMGDCLHAAVYLHGNLYPIPMLAGSDDNSPHIAVTIGNQTLTAMIDTGSPNTVLFRGAAGRLGLDPNKAGFPRVSARGIGHGVTSGTVRKIAAIGVGDLEFDNVPVLVADASLGSVEHPTDMLLGMDFLSKFHPWISFSSNTLVLQYPPAPSPSE